MARTYSAERERHYYRDSATDRRAVPYGYLTAYVRGSFGEDFVRGKSVLDLGCGEGTYAAWMADVGGASEVLGVDLTENRLRTDYMANLPNLRLVAADLFQYVPPKAFDVVFMNLVLHHLRFRLRDAVDLVHRSLAPGGRFVAIEPNFCSPVALLMHMKGARSENEGFISPWRISRAFSERGFECVEYGFFWRDRAWARNPLLASCMWISANKPSTAVLAP